jgi:hypothetical protein
MYQVKWDSVKKWLLKYGKKELPGRILICNGRELDRIRELEKEYQTLMGLIGKQQVRIVYQNELIRLARERLGEDFEKK